MNDSPALTEQERLMRSGINAAVVIWSVGVGGLTTIVVSPVITALTENAWWHLATFTIAAMVTALVIRRWIYSHRPPSTS